MGFDATLGFVVNMGAPQSPVAYYQQVGRAGRGTDRASVVLLPQPEDRDIWAYFASLAFPREDQVRHTLGVLADEGRPLSTAALETYVDLGRTRLEQMLKVLDVDGAVRRVRGGWEATGEPWTYDAERYARVSEARKREQQAMLDYLDTDRCRMWFLRDQLDDPAIEGTSAAAGATGAAGSSCPRRSPATRSTRRGRGWRGPASSIEPRSMWPTALANLGLDLKGRIGEGAEPGRAVARLTDLGHGQALRELFGGEPHDSRLPDSLVHAVIEVLQDWRPHVEGIVVVESATRPSLTADLADGLSPLPASSDRRSLGDRRPVGRARPGSGELRPARRRGLPPVPAGGRRPAGAGAPRRRPGGDGLDPDRRRASAPRGRRDGGAAPRARGPRLGGPRSGDDRQTLQASVGVGQPEHHDRDGDEQADRAGRWRRWPGTMTARMKKSRALPKLCQTIFTLSAIASAASSCWSTMKNSVNDVRNAIRTPGRKQSTVAMPVATAMKMLARTTCVLL